MHPTEFWWLADARRPKKDYNGFTEDEMEEMYQEMMTLEKELENEDA